MSKTRTLALAINAVLRLACVGVLVLVGLPVALVFTLCGCGPWVTLAVMAAAATLGGALGVCLARH